jgi:hypothetical protein
MHTTLTDPAIVAALIYGQRLPDPRPSAVLLNADNTVRWDAGEEVFMPKRADRRAKGLPVEPRTAALRDRQPSRLLDIMARANCDAVNACGLADLTAVVFCIAQAPFPLGHGAEAFLLARRHIEQAFTERAAYSLAGEVYAPPAGTVADWLLGFTNTTLGQLRRWLVNRAGEGCNAPTDGYLRMAAWFAAHPDATAADLPHDYAY